MIKPKNPNIGAENAVSLSDYIYIYYMDDKEKTKTYTAECVSVF